MAGGTDSQGAVISGINVTPLVDVMLVLLVIFMVTAPMMQTGVAVELPQTSAAAPLKSDEAPLVVSVTRDGAIYLNDVSMDMEALLTKLTAIRKENPAQTVYLRGDHAASYGLVVGVIAALKGAGVEQVGMITEPGER